MYGVRRNVKKLEKSILKYEEQPIQTGRILFYGHSMFTRWSEKYGHRPLEEDIRMKDGSPAALNHGFGSSTADDLLYYYHRMVKPYEPRVLVLTAGGNDFPLGYSAHEVVNNLAKLIDYAQADFPGLPVFVLDCMPTPKRNGKTEYFTRLRVEFNEILEDYCNHKENVTFVRTSNLPFLYEKPEDMILPPTVREDIFVEDKTHFNQEGYDHYAQFFREVLDEYL